MKYALAPLALFTLLVSTSVPAMAQGEYGEEEELVPCLPYLPANNIPFPTPGYGDPTDFGRAVVGDFDGDLAPDAVCVAGTGDTDCTTRL